MTLIKSISGIRGTIGGKAGEGLNPLDIVKFTSAYATLIRRISTVGSNKIVVGRDARISGEMVKNVVCGTLMGMGFDVINIGLASTPTTELAVTMAGACGGIILTASHNPKQWNALKLLNEHGEFLNAAEGQEVLRIAEAEAFEYADIDHLGSYTEDNSYNEKHIDSVLALKLVDVEAIRRANFHVAIDCVNSVGGIILPQLLERLGVQHVEKLYCEPTGNFQHNPEPLEKNLGDIMNLMKEGKVQHWGVCELSAESIRKAHAVCPLTAVQSEYHLMHRLVEENGVLDTCRELGIGFVPYSPINRGFLGGDLNEYTQFDPNNDNRNTLPRFTPEAMRANYRIVNALQRFGRERGMTSAQLALGWLLQKAPWIVPIPGTTKLSHLEENLRTLDFSLTPEEWQELENMVSAIPVMGDRYNAEQQKQVGG